MRIPRCWRVGIFLAATPFLAFAASLNGTWKLEFRPQQEGGDWRQIPAQVPGDTHDALYAAGLIPNLEVGTNVFTVFRYEAYEWRYSRTFKAPELAMGERAQLRFEGVDTRATYSLNGKVIGTSANMYIPHVFDVTDQLQPENELVVHIASPLGRDLLPVLGRSRVGGTDVEGIRKAQHMFGWDIMPRLVSSGIWRDVCLDVVSPERFGDVHWMVVRTDPKARTAFVRVDCQVLVPWSRLHSARLRLSLSRKGQTAFAKEYTLRYLQTRDSFTVNDAELWWPRSAGAQPLYDAVAELVDEKGQVLARNARRIGLRSIILERADYIDEAHPGTFRFVVNGEPIYMHGTDWSPMSALHGRDAQFLPKCLEMLKDLNCNMVRVWGGGVYETESFYDFCDANGICVWQDFMMGNVEPEQNDRFAAAISEEARAIVLRLRSHPCLALWCGNNEQDRSVGALWRERAPDPARDRISREVLPRVLRDFDPLTSYLPSSPLWNAQTRTGDPLSQDHLWGPRAMYYKGDFWMKAAPTFVSETGYHGCTNPESLRRMMTPGGLYPWPDKSDKNHFNDEWSCKSTISWPEQLPMAHGRNALMSRQTANLFGVCPEGLEDFAEASQIVQAEALKTWIELSRTRKGRTWGLLWWNLRDGWPILSDGVVDYYFGRKRAYGAIRKCSHDAVVIVRDDHKVFAVNDRRQPIAGTTRITDKASGRVVFEKTFTVPANGVAELGELPWEGQGVFRLESELAGDKMENHYLYGLPPFDFSSVRQLLQDEY
ncbi:MAG: glycoside hydrolase family 2 [Kiritimatiellae bacterium]|nr:glycoside hydrolase family 2 [Kiritimatiellia bacterium]